MSNLRGQSTTGFVLLCALGGLGGAFGGVAISRLATRSGADTQSALLADFDVRNGIILVGNPYTCALKTVHFAQLEAASNRLGVSPRFLVPGNPEDSLGMSDITTDFQTAIRPEMVPWSTLQTLTGTSSMRFPTVVVVRGGKVTAVLQSPTSTVALSHPELFFGVDGVNALPPPTTPSPES